MDNSLQQVFTNVKHSFRYDGDNENNLQGEMWRHADRMVKHVLAGDDWAMKKFALGQRYDCQKVRETVAKCIPKELQDARVADLEAQVEQLKRDIAFYRDRR